MICVKRLEEKRAALLAEQAAVAAHRQVLQGGLIEAEQRLIELNAQLALIAEIAEVVEAEEEAFG